MNAQEKVEHLFEDLKKASPMERAHTASALTLFLAYKSNVPEATLIDILEKCLRNIELTAKIETLMLCLKSEASKGLIAKGALSLIAEDKKNKTELANLSLLLKPKGAASATDA